MSHIQRFLNGSSTDAMSRRDSKALALTVSTERRAAALARVREQLAHVENLARQAETTARGREAMHLVQGLVAEARALADGDEFTAELLLDTLQRTKQLIDGLI